jgi:hypothetical protein
MMADASWKKKLPGTTTADPLRARDTIPRPVAKYLAALDAALPVGADELEPIEPKGYLVYRPAGGFGAQARVGTLCLCVVACDDDRRELQCKAVCRSHSMRPTKAAGLRSSRRKSHSVQLGWDVRRKEIGQPLARQLFVLSLPHRSCPVVQALPSPEFVKMAG